MSISGHTTTQKNVAKYKTGQRVYYKSSSYVGMVNVVKVHLDDELEPFYTISVDGKEKQTDDAHLTLKSPVQVEVESILLELSDQQLKDVLDYTTRLKNGSPASATVTQQPSRSISSPASATSVPAGNAAISPAPVGLPTLPQHGGHFQHLGQMPMPQTLFPGQTQLHQQQSQLPPPQQQQQQQSSQPPNFQGQQQHQPSHVQQPPTISNGFMPASGTIQGGASMGGIPSPGAGIPSPSVVPPINQASNAFHGAATSLPGPPLAAQQQLQQHASGVDSRTAPGSGPMLPAQQQPPAPSLQGGNPFDIY